MQVLLCTYHTILKFDTANDMVYIALPFSWNYVTKTIEHTRVLPINTSM